MFDMLEEIISIIVGSVLLLSTLVGFIVSIVKSFKNKKLANNAQTINEITSLASDKVIEIEKLYSQAAQVLKVMGIQTGAIKKESVMNFIENKCAQKGINFDYDFWSAEVEKLITVMNTNKEADKQLDNNAQITK